MRGIHIDDQEIKERMYEKAFYAYFSDHLNDQSKKNDYELEAFQNYRGERQIELLEVAPSAIKIYKKTLDKQVNIRNVHSIKFLSNGCYISLTGESVSAERQIHGGYVMNNRELRLTAEYLNVVVTLVKNYNITSVAKIVFLSILVRNEINPPSGKHSLVERHLSERHLSELSRFYDRVESEMKHVLASIDVLCESGLFSFYEGLLIAEKPYEYEIQHNKLMNSASFKKCIEMVIHMSDKSFLKEVISTV